MGSVIICAPLTTKRRRHECRGRTARARVGMARVQQRSSSRYLGWNCTPQRRQANQRAELPDWSSSSTQSARHFGTAGARGAVTGGRFHVSTGVDVDGIDQDAPHRTPLVHRQCAEALEGGRRNARRQLGVLGGRLAVESRGGTAPTAWACRFHAKFRLDPVGHVSIPSAAGPTQGTERHAVRLGFSNRRLCHDVPGPGRFFQRRFFNVFQRRFFNDDFLHDLDGDLLEVRRGPRLD